MLFTRFLSPIFISLFCLNFCNSLPTIDQNPNKKSKFEHPPITPLTSPIFPLQSSEETINSPPLLSTQQPNFPHLLSTVNMPPVQSNQQPRSLPPLISNQQNHIKSANNLLSDHGQCGVCLERKIKLHPDCYQCLSKNDNTKSHEFCMDCIVKMRHCPLCKAPVTHLYHHMVLLKKKIKCDRRNNYQTFQSCLMKLLKETITSISIYPEIRSICEEIIKHCVLNINGSDNMAFELVLENYNILSMELIDFLILKYGSKASYSDYIIIIIKKYFGFKTKKYILDINPIIALVEKYGNVSDYSKYNSQVIESSLEWTMPNFSAVTRFITHFGNQLSDHELFYKSALEATIRDHSMKVFNHLVVHFKLDKNILLIRSVILDVIAYSFRLENFALIEPIIKRYGKQDEVVDYLKLIIEFMTKGSITTQTYRFIDKFARLSDLPILVNHAITLSIQESKLDFVKFIIYMYGIPSSYKLYIFLAIHTSVSLSQFNNIEDFIQHFGLKEQYNEYFETAIMSCLFYSNFQHIARFKTVYGNGITDEAFISKTIILGIKMDLFESLKVFIKEFGNSAHYLDYISLFESFKGTGKDEKIEDFVTLFYFNE